MSGYRSLHREAIESTAIWDVVTSPLLTTKRRIDKHLQNSSSVGNHRIWTASADGLVRSYRLEEKTMEEKQQSSVLDASAVSVTCTHVLLGKSQTTTDSSSSSSNTAAAALGCTRLCVVRNYVGQDDAAGDLVVASLEMSGIVRIWSFSETLDDDYEYDDKHKKDLVPCLFEFQVENATGTVMMLCPPNVWTGHDLCVAVACLDGTIAQVATGIATPSSRIIEQQQQTSREPTPPGTILDRWGSQGSAIPLSIASHPMIPVAAVGRQNGQVDILTPSTSSNNNNNNNNNNNQKESHKHWRHRLRLPGHESYNNNTGTNHGLAIRALAYTPDGNMLCAGNDAGMLAVWDVSRQPPALAHHIVQAHASWILHVTALPDSRRWVTCGADRKIHVWKVDQMYQPVHTFDSDHTVWTLAMHARSDHGNNMLEKNKQKASLRMAAGTDTGWLQVFSLDG
jgi:WD40 repeat protein